MPPDINTRIQDTIERGGFDPKVKAFLLRMLSYELEHVSQSMWFYMDVYEKELVATAPPPAKSTKPDE